MNPALKLAAIGWLVAIVLVTGFGVASSTKAIGFPCSLFHKLGAVVCLVLILLRISGALNLFKSSPAIPLAIWCFAAAFLAAFVTGVVHSLPIQAGPLWLNLHRITAALSAVACAVAARMILLGAR
jgi:hypothetical protein